MSEPVAPEPSASDRSNRSARFHSYLHRYKSLLARRWWIPAITISIGLVLEGWLVWHTPDTFNSFSKMVLNYRISSQPNSGMGSVNEEMNTFIGTQIEWMQSDNVKSLAATRVQELHPELPAPAYLPKIQINVPLRTSVFYFTATGNEPRYTQAYLDGVMEAYIITKKEKKGEAAGDSLESIRKEIARLDRELRRSSEAMINYRATNSVVVLQEEGSKANTYLAKLKNELNEFKTQYDLYRRLSLEQNLQQDSLKEKIAPNPTDNTTPGDTTSEVLQSAGYLQLKRKIELKKGELAELAKDLRPKHPKIVTLNEDINHLENTLGILKTEKTQQLSNIISSLEIQIASHTDQIKEHETEAAEIGRKMAVYDKLKMENERNQTLYNRMEDAMKMLDTTKDADPNQVVVMATATPSIHAPSKLARSLAIGAILGCILGFGILLLIDRLDDRPTSFTELQDSFDEPILGQIPQEISNARNGASNILKPDDQRHAFVEAYRNLRSSLLYMATEGKRAKIILVTSAVPGDGKSTTTTNMAITLAQSGSRVLLIDGDMRRGALHKHFNAAPEPGLNEVLSKGHEWNKAVVVTATPNLSIIPRGALSKQPGELFLQPLTRQFLAEAAAQYDYVVIDSAPVMAADDVTSLSPHVEGVVFVIRSSYTSGRVAHAALDLLYQRNVNVLGIVFNGVQARASEYYFYKYKDYYSSGA